MNKVDNKMNIVFAVSKEYAKYAMVMLCSLFESNRNRLIDVYVMVEEDLGEWKDNLEKLVGNYENKICFIMLPFNKRKDEIRNIWSASINTDRWRAIELLPEDVQRFLMLDIDIIVMGDLWELYNSDFEDKYMIMCRDMAFEAYYGCDAEWMLILRDYQAKKEEKRWGNCGVTLVNQKIKEIFNYNFMIDTIIKNHYLSVDQDYLNVDMGEYILFIDPYEYNYITDAGNCEYKEVINKVKIIHFAGIKPWENYDGLWKKIWFEYARKVGGNLEDIVQNYDRYVNDQRYIACESVTEYRNLLHRWMEIRDKGCTVFDNIGIKYQIVAIYGAGKMCKHLLSDMRQTTIQCKGIFDINLTVDKVGGFEVCHDLEVFLSEIQEVEIIIVTAIVSYDEIESILKDKTDRKIISLAEIIKGKRII